MEAIKTLIIIFSVLCCTVAFLMYHFSDEKTKLEKVQKKIVSLGLKIRCLWFIL